MAAADPISRPISSATLGTRIDHELFVFLGARRREAEELDDRATILIDEIRRLIAAGGKRLRPAFCYWGYRATGAPDDDRIVRAAAALELLHTFALIHDDLIDGSDERRGVPSSHRELERSAGRGTADASRFGRAAALLAGDLAVVLADELLLASGFEADTLLRAQAAYHEMREELAAGQLLGLLATPRDEAEARRLASLKGGAYSVLWPLTFGATLAAGSASLLDALSAFGRPLGEAFQLRDDLLDDPASSPVGKETVNALVAEAKAALVGRVLDAEAVRALDALADHVALP
jgi:geranylgeranyl diphosphate synthase type I